MATELSTPAPTLPDDDIRLAVSGDTRSADEALVEEELLVEEVSIDGMCGVY